MDVRVIINNQAKYYVLLISNYIAICISRIWGGLCPLHYVCSDRAASNNNVDWEFHTYICVQFTKWYGSIEMIRFLLDMGACSDLLDDNGYTPLHIAASSHNPLQSELLSIFLENGAHYDSINSVRNTFNDILKLMNGQRGMFDNPLRHVTLKCLAAKTIKQYGINWNNEIPSELINFVLSH